MSEVMAGINRMPPKTTPRPAAIERIHASTLSGVWKPGPNIASAQPSPEVASQLNRRCRAIASTVTITSASPIDRHRTRRIGGDRICESAFTAASNMIVLSSGGCSVGTHRAVSRLRKPASKTLDFRHHLFDGRILDGTIASDLHGQHRDLDHCRDSLRM